MIPDDTAAQASFHFEHAGYCGICEKHVLFSAKGPYFRNTLKCPSCGSVPRNRALFHVLTTHFPSWRNLAIHESSPGWDRVSARLREESSRYVATQWDPKIPFGSLHPHKGYRSEDLQSQTFADSHFDLVVTQDVFEHIFRPDLAIKEIARTLKDGGAFICTVPIVRKVRPTIRRASLVEREVKHLLEPQYHGNPVSKDGSLVTVDWGYDIISYLQHHSGLSFMMLQIDNIDLGIRADLNEVLIGFKRAMPALESD